MSLLSKNSPLRQVPAGLDRRQAITVDGLVHSVEVAHMCYERLSTTTASLVSADDIDAPLMITSAFSDAWSIVDAAHRFRQLLGQLRGLKQSSPGITAFQKHTNVVEDLRHYVQHLSNELLSVAESASPIWGTLTWRIPGKNAAPQSEQYHIVPGTIFDKISTRTIPLKGPADQIVLSAFDHSLDLADVLERMKGIIFALEETMRNQFVGEESDTDGVYWFGIHVNEEGSSMQLKTRIIRMND